MNEKVFDFKRIFALVFCLLLFGANVWAQTEKSKDATQTVSQAQTAKSPAVPIRDFIVLKQSSLVEMEKRLGTNKIEDLIGGAGQQLRVAVQTDDDKDFGDAEVHDRADDVFYVLEGTATLTLGGKLENPREISNGEWRGKTINGGRDVAVAKGDLIVVPRGTPHRRSTKNQEFSMILIKIFAEPVAPPTTPAIIKGKNDGKPNK